MNQASFTSVIVTYNSANEITNLLADLRQHAPTSKIIVIDNASKDKTVDTVQKNFPEVLLIKNRVNLGYAKAVNQGFDLCKTDFVLLLNPDIRISSSDIILKMLLCIKHSKNIAVVAPLQFKDDEKKHYLNLTWSYSTPETFKIYLSHLIQKDVDLTDPIQVTFLNAGCLFIRRHAFEHIGKLNEKYFMYGEEPDLFLKFKRFGYNCYLLPNISVTHYRERSLKTTHIFRRLLIKLQAAWNIADALITGSTRILMDKLTSKSLGSERKHI